MVNAFKSTKKRVLLLDLNGTIVWKEPTGKYLKRDVLGSSGMCVEPEVGNIMTTLLNISCSIILTMLSPISF